MEYRKPLLHPLPEQVEFQVNEKSVRIEGTITRGYSFAHFGCTHFLQVISASDVMGLVR